eukprot:GEMP01119373.1.p2 GENE.GEMP01119373.1~~GEMP01119373.1.p2  ORF type:complete len:109 (+),score=8.38 GEMP01119373.1:136-462(+)
MRGMRGACVRLCDRRGPHQSPFFLFPGAGPGLQKKTERCARLFFGRTEGFVPDFSFCAQFLVCLRALFLLSTEFSANASAKKQNGRWSGTSTNKKGRFPFSFRPCFFA